MQMKDFLTLAARIAGLLFCTAVLGGCAAGNTYDYRSALLGLPLAGSADVEVEVVDKRPYVLSGDKTPSFVGLQRGGYGNPFDVKTTSGEPLAADMEVALSSILTEKGYNVVDSSGQRRLQIVLNEWKSDVMLRLRVIYDIAVNIFDAEGELLASNAIDGEAVTGGGYQGANSANAASTFEVKVTELLRDEQVQEAMLSE